jgi:hypothetical protein
MGVSELAVERAVDSEVVPDPPAVDGSDDVRPPHAASVSVSKSADATMRDDPRIKRENAKIVETSNPERGSL